MSRVILKKKKKTNSLGTDDYPSGKDSSGAPLYQQVSYGRSGMPFGEVARWYWGIRSLEELAF